MTWLVLEDEDHVSVVPDGDLTAAHTPDDCVCGPRWEWRDPDTGDFYARPLVVHHSLDGRENEE